MESNTIKILRLDASANPESSGSRKLGDYLLRQIAFANQRVEIRERDLNHDAQFIDANWIEANFSAADDRSEAHNQRLAQSDKLIAELEWADHIVLTTPMYNFAVPATLKAWIDQICRAGVSFQYTAEGPVGLLAGKRADIVITTGGAPLDSPIDFVSGYLRQVFAFIGISEVNITGADGMNRDAEQSIARARRQIEQHYPAAAA
jgi:FMN-dependent NADH-azoreductase